MKILNLIQITRKLLEDNNYSQSKTIEQLMQLFKVDMITAENAVDHCMDY